MAHSHRDLLRQIFGQPTDPDLKQHVLKHAALGLHTLGLTKGLDRHQNGHLLVLGHLVEIHVQHLAAKRMVLDFLHQRQPLGARIVLDGKVNQ